MILELIKVKKFNSTPTTITKRHWSKNSLESIGMNIFSNILLIDAITTLVSLKYSFFFLQYCFYALVSWRNRHSESKNLFSAICKKCNKYFFNIFKKTLKLTFQKQSSKFFNLKKILVFDKLKGVLQKIKQNSLILKIEDKFDFNKFNFKLNLKALTINVSSYLSNIFTLLLRIDKKVAQKYKLNRIYVSFVKKLFFLPSPKFLLNISYRNNLNYFFIIYFMEILNFKVISAQFSDNINKRKNNRANFNFFSHQYLIYRWVDEYTNVNNLYFHKKHSIMYTFENQTLRNTQKLFYTQKRDYFLDFLFFKSTTKNYLFPYQGKKSLFRKKYLALIEGKYFTKLKKIFFFAKKKVRNKNLMIPNRIIQAIWFFLWSIYLNFSLKLQLNLTLLKYVPVFFLTKLYHQPTALTNLFNPNDFSFKKKFRLLIFKKLSKFYKNTNAFARFFYFYFLNFFENFFKTRLYLKIYWSCNLSNRLINLFYYLTKKHFVFQIYIGKGFFLDEMFYILFYTFKYKDLYLFKYWLKINLEKMFFAKHKKFFYKLKWILKSLFSLFVKLFKVRGFYLSISGKIAVSGNSRKRRYLISLGFSSFSSYKYKLNYTKYLIRTKTGALGLTTALSYC